MLELAQADPQLAHIIAAYPWLADGLTDNEANGLDQIGGLLIELAQTDQELAHTIAAYPWLSDGLTEDGWQAAATALYRIREMAQADPQLAHIIAAYPWLADGLTDNEANGLDQIGGLLIELAQTDQELAHIIAAYPWLADGLTEDGWQNTATAIYQLREWAQTNPGLAHTIAAYPWVADGLTNYEAVTMEQIGNSLVEVAQTDLASARSVAAHTWLVNLLEDDTWGNYSSVVNLLALLPQTDPAIVQQINSYPWAADGLTPHAAYSLIRVLELPTDLALTITAYPWVADGIIGGNYGLFNSTNESSALGSVASIVRATADANRLSANEIAAYHWIADGISPDEEFGLRKITDLNHVLYAPKGDPVEIAAYHWVADGLSPAEVIGLGNITDITYSLRYSSDASTALAEEIADYPWVADGLDDYELAFLLVLDAAARQSIPRFNALLEAHHTRSAVVTLPLAGEVELLAFRLNPFPEDDDSIELLQQIIPVMEGFMGIPFPHRPVVMWIVGPGLDEVENRTKIRNLSGPRIIAVNSREHNSRFRLDVFEEAANIYWGSQSNGIRFIDGASEFMTGYARELFGEHRIEERRAELLLEIEQDCTPLGVNNLWQLFYLAIDNPDEYAEREFCKYLLGELFYIEAYQLLGPDAVFAAMRQVYLYAENTGAGIAERDIWIYIKLSWTTPMRKSR